jgi:nitrite reductase (NADH) small subunit
VAVRQHAVGPAERFPPDTTTVVTVAGRSVGIVNAAGTFYAVLDVCPHELAPICEHGVVTGTSLPSLPGQVKYGLQNRVLRCPWHGYEFDLETGRALFTNFRGKLRTFPVTVVDGQVAVELAEERLQRG